MGVTFNLTVFVRGMTVKLLPCFRVCGWGWETTYRKECEDSLLSWQGSHFWVCITFCKVRHGDSVTKPDYHYLLFLLIYDVATCNKKNCILYKSSYPNVTCEWAVLLTYLTVMASLAIGPSFSTSIFDIFICCRNLKDSWVPPNCLFSSPWTISAFIESSAAVDSEKFMDVAKVIRARCKCIKILHLKPAKM